MPMSRLWITALALALCWAATATGAAAHPHVFIVMQMTVLYDKGAFIGVRHRWTFDEFYTAMAIEGLDSNKDGVYDREELAELAKVNVEGLKEFGYFTIPALAGKEIKVGEVRDYWLEHKDGALSLYFTLPFASPVLAEAPDFTVSVFDPTYYIAFDFAKADPVRLSDSAPRGCEAKLATAAERPGEKSALEILQERMGSYAAGIAKTIIAQCRIVDAAPEQHPPAAAPTTPAPAPAPSMQSPR
jgi:ABC-type uncharacterized transport system substrate-binding protein